MVGGTRPLSGGAWSLLGWLRREERGSSDSLASDAGSFAYLPPARAPAALPAPLTRTPPSPTPSCARRLQDREFRRLADRDLTLHRKYRLPLGAGFDNRTLPPPRRAAAERERRAASESLPRRAHVPGKRRAPPPPRARTIKRRAPPPPPAPIPEDREHSPLEGNENAPAPTPSASATAELVSEARSVSERKSEEIVKKNELKPKPERERSFLRQIFDNKKRNSAIDPPQVKLLSTISELDRQAAELLQSYRLRAFEYDRAGASEMRAGDSRGSSSRGETWFCTRCLKKYDSTMVTCLDCMSQAQMSAGSSKYKDTCLALKRADNQTNTGIVLNNIWNNSSSFSKNTEEKQKLKEMLKEMKDSLPKRPKPDKNEGKKLYFNRPQHTYEVIDNKETPTLPMGASMHSDVANIPQPSVSTGKDAVSPKVDKKVDGAKIIHASPIARRATETVLITQTTVLVDHSKIPQESAANPGNNRKEAIENKIIREEINNPADNTARSTNIINQPLRISSLLNPVYIPKNSTNDDKSVFSQKETFLLQDNTRLIRETSTSVIALGASTSGNQTGISLKTPPPISIANAPSCSKEAAMQTTSAQPQVTQTTSSQPLVTQTTSAQPLVTQTISAQPLVTQTTSAQPLVTQTTSAQPLVTQTTSAQPLVTQTTSAQPLVTQSTSALPLVTQTTSALPLVTKIKVAEHQARPHISSAASPVIITKVSAKENLPKSHKNIPEKVTSTNAEASKTTFTPFQQTAAVITPPTSGVIKPIISPMMGQKGNPSIASDQHSKRRDLINQLESSIAKGDEKAAADAAIRLAQLRLSCSVLSFTSQIMNDASPSTSTAQEQTTCSSKISATKVDSATQSVGTRCTKSVTEAVKLTNTTATPKIATSSNRNDKQLPQTSTLMSAAEISNSIAASSPSTSKSEKEDDDEVNISVWVEDRAAARGPVPLRLPRDASLAALRHAAARRLGLPAVLQRWIVGRALCTSDAQLRRALAVNRDEPFYLCLVEPEDKTTPSQPPELNTKPEDKPSDVYSELMALELQGLVFNTESFECGVCLEECGAGAGGVLRACAHAFCRGCLAAAVRHCAEPPVACPAVACAGALEEREVRQVCSAAEHAAWLARGLAAAARGAGASHCRTRDCAGWALCDAGVTAFPCPVCRAVNCLPCQAIHTGSTCEEHRSRLRLAAASEGEASADAHTAALLHTMIERGEALPCPECSAVIIKKWGCDWVRCPACKTELCWVTRGRRWGPAGRGDTSAGCRCGEGGRRCHPACGYCH